MEKVDDDCVIMPNWMFEVLRIKENEPVSISLDLNIAEMKFYDVK